MLLSFATVNCLSKTDTLEHVLSAVFSLNFSSAGKRPFLTGKAKNIHQGCSDCPGGKWGEGHMAPASVGNF